MRMFKSWLATVAVASALLGATAAQAQWWGGTPYTGGSQGGRPRGYPYNYNGWNNNSGGQGWGNGNMNLSTDIGGWGNG